MSHQNTIRAYLVRPKGKNIIMVFNEGELTGLLRKGGEVLDVATITIGGLDSAVSWEIKQDRGIFKVHCTPPPEYFEEADYLARLRMAPDQPDSTRERSSRR